MDTIDASTYEAILKVIHAWSPEQRFHLVQDVLKMLAAEATRGARRAPTLDEALGLLASDRPAPSDAEVAAWLDERRTRKYG